LADGEVKTLLHMYCDTTVRDLVQFNLMPLGQILRPRQQQQMLDLKGLGNNKVNEKKEQGLPFGQLSA
jgi:hypothetical protein